MKRVKMMIDFTTYQRDLLRDLVVEEIESVKSGETVYGGPDEQSSVLEELNEILDKL